MKKSVDSTAEMESNKSSGHTMGPMTTRPFTQRGDMSFRKSWEITMQQDDVWFVGIISIYSQSLFGKTIKQP